MRGAEDQAALFLRQAAVKAQKTGRPACSRFLSGAQKEQARRLANELGIAVSFWGGWPDADRVLACYHEKGDDPEWTLDWVSVRWDARFQTVRHSDLLGSLMALGIDHDRFGDLILNADGCSAWLAALPETARRLPDEWTGAGKAGIRCEVSGRLPEIRVPQGRIVSCTAASLRLDAVLAAGANRSRAAACEMIRAGLVSVNHTAELRPDAQLAEGSLLSVRGFGRIRVTHVGAPTRKDRIPLSLELFTRTD